MIFSAKYMKGINGWYEILVVAVSKEEAVSKIRNVKCLSDWDEVVILSY